MVPSFRAFDAKTSQEASVSPGRSGEGVPERQRSWPLSPHQRGSVTVPQSGGAKTSAWRWAASQAPPFDGRSSSRRRAGRAPPRGWRRWRRLGRRSPGAPQRRPAQPLACATLDHVATYRSVIHNRFGPVAVKSRLTRSPARAAPWSWRVVKIRRPRRTQRMP